MRLEPNPDHARSPLVTLTKAGRRVLADQFALSDESRRALLDRAGVTATELTEVRRIIRAMVTSFDDS